MAGHLRTIDDRIEHLALLAGDRDREVDSPPPEASANDGGTMVIDDRYQLLGCIGRGATGSVYRAHDRTLDRHVAIKILEPGQGLVAEREAQVLARIRHRNVVTIHDFGRGSGYRYLVLELLEGRDFRRWLKSKPTPEDILARFIEAGRGLAAAHAAGLVHRDFKPSNLILTNEPTLPHEPAPKGLVGPSGPKGQSGRVVVIDFGLARTRESLADIESTTGFTEGTLAYMAPERFIQAEGDERSDQFAFCVALWEALAGHNPFSGDEPISRYQSIARGPLAADLDVPRHVVAALQRGLSFAPEDRFESMNDLLAELERPAVFRLTGKHERLAGRMGPKKSLLSALAVAATFLLGWGIAPDSPVVEDAHSDLGFKPVRGAAMRLLESARRSLAEGDTEAAFADYDLAFDLVYKQGRGTATFCEFGEHAGAFADALLVADDVRHARAVYARAVMFANDCHASPEQLEALRAKTRLARDIHLSRQSVAELSAPRAELKQK